MNIITTEQSIANINSLIDMRNAIKKRIEPSKIELRAITKQIASMRYYHKHNPKL